MSLGIGHLRVPTTALSRVLIIGVLVVTAVSTSTQRADADLSPLGGTIVFSPSGNLTLLAGRAGNGQTRELTSAGIDTSPEFSPGGKRVVFVRGGDIWLLRLATLATRRLTTGGRDGSPAWSPNGRRIAFTRRDGSGNTDIFVIRAWGGRAFRFSRIARLGCNATAPAWSPNGSLLTYTRQYGTTSNCRAGVVVQRHGHPARVVVADPSATDADFTPDGTALVYSADCDPERCTYTGGWMALLSGGSAWMVVTRDDCIEGSLCFRGLIGAGSGKEFIESSTYAAEDGAPVYNFWVLERPRSTDGSIDGNTAESYSTWVVDPQVIGWDYRTQPF
jgi:dipeptidyl aminopeptidase/acylaminoacyl peptidase